ncbi:MAG: hypothetical protein KDD50_11765, partial [Bdellovibrionales bacterium]|nr:hypothetical protein [Bdellovibrionales bacterium]
LKKQIVENDTNINDVKYIDSLLDHYLALSVTHPDIYGQLNHYSQLVAANAFLKTRDIEKASKRLVESCTYDGFILKSFGPNMMVAKRFLEEGHQAPVIEFLQNCQSYWYDRKAYIWEEEISNGTMPDFGENLNY